MTEKCDLAKKYQKKSDKEHILDNPDTYIGSVELLEDNLYIYDDNNIIEKKVSYNPGLLKLFDEGIVNCRDHYIRTKNDSKIKEKVTKINVNIENDVITMFNNGCGIDIEIHPEYNKWIPELIFGHLRTSTNYDKKQEKITGGKNGFGFKLVIIWSEFAEIETVDKKRKKKYYQKFGKNLDVIHEPVITNCTSEPYTKVTFKPDYKRLKLSGLSDDLINYFKRRCYDIAGVTSKDLKVKFNDVKLNVNDFQSYIKLYLDDNLKKQLLFENVNERWSYGICLSNEYKHISFVNGIYTSKGGKHVDYIVNQITKKMVTYIKQKKKIDVKNSIIKEQLFVFVNCSIVNPSFDSQTKDYLNTSVANFGSTCEVSNIIIDKLAKLGVMNASCALSDIKEKNKAKKSDGQKNKTIRGIPKLVDANFAGTKKSDKTMLILCEGDSAKSGIVSGLSSDDRNFIGVYPMKGKIFNVRGETQKKINESKEIAEIKQIIGLETGKKYNDTSKLRYSKIVFMTDQDLDGSHIKGLCINFLSYLWPSLLNIPNFVAFMNTPILKATKLKKTIDFYNIGDYEKWKSNNNDGKGFKIKYYKGLGTSTSNEFKEYFKNKKIIHFNINNDTDTMMLDKIFNKNKANERKSWLETYNRERQLDNNKDIISYSEFINDDFIHFSKYDCDRSIPNLMDGLKISQRKILYSAFKKNLYSEIKVAQFSGYVSEHSGYHHGEASLNGAIVTLAHNFVGSNNINIFEPNGQFGTRLQGGKDSASERYIYTRLNNITRFIFRPEDDNILNYLDDDGTMVEPLFYIPIIPMILINGALGIGTGFSTNIPCFNPIEIIQYIKNYINKHANININPYYRNFKGKIEQVEDLKYISTGNIIENNNKLIITELPIGVWTEPYIIFIEKCIENNKFGIKDYNDLSTDKNINIEVIFDKSVDLNNKQELRDICKNLKLVSNISMTNMYLFNKDEKLIHYASVYEILEEFIVTRLDYYVIRKNFQLKELKKTLVLLSNKYKFILEILNDTLDLRKKKNNEIIEILKNKDYDKIENSFSYLTKMPMDSVNEENVDKLKNEYDDINNKIDELTNKSVDKIYYDELNILEKELKKWF
tara:strand:+ start:2116 stop:5418 length:3303 start_codon:yes stop_codon:yes gene_type:complete